MTAGSEKPKHCLYATPRARRPSVGTKYGKGGGVSGKGRICWLTMRMSPLIRSDIRVAHELPDVCNFAVVLMFTGSETFLPATPPCPRFSICACLLCWGRVCLFFSSFSCLTCRQTVQPQVLASAVGFDNNVPLRRPHQCEDSRCEHGLSDRS